MTARPPPIYLDAPAPPPDPAHRAAVIFLHGLGDDGAGVQNIGEQMHARSRTQHATWVFPTAPENRDAMANAWYAPTRLTARPPPRPELADDEDEEGLRRSVREVEALVADLEGRGVPASRIVVAGFSQGAAVALATALLSTTCAGRLAGVCGICGYLPLAERMGGWVAAAGGAKTTRIFWVRGARDVHVPRRYHRIVVETLEELGLVGEGLFKEKEYEGLGHGMGPALLADFADWLEGVIPLS